MEKSLWVCLVALLVVFPTACGSPSPTPVTPQSGAHLVGSIETGEKAGSGQISFFVHESDGSIIKLTIVLTDVKCDGFTAGQIEGWVGDVWRAQVTGGSFKEPLPALGGLWRNFTLPSQKPWPTVAPGARPGEIEGSFSSPTEASGTIEIFLSIPDSRKACPLGRFAWSAKAP